MAHFFLLLLTILAAYTLYFPLTLAYLFVAHILAAPAAVIAGTVTALVGLFLGGFGQRHVSRVFKFVSRSS